MKKFLTIIALFLSVILTAQEQVMPLKLQLTAGGGTHSINLAGSSDLVYLYGTAVMTSNWTVNSTGTAYEGMLVNIRYEATMDFNGNTMTIFGLSIPATYQAKSFTVQAYYNGSSWDSWFAPSFTETAVLNTAQIVDGAVTSVKIANANVSLDNFVDLTRGWIMVGNATNRPSFYDASTSGQILIGDGNDLLSVAISGDATLSAAGVLTLGNDVVDNNKLANIARGSILVGGVANAPTYLDAKTDGYILIGDGTDLNSVDVTGAIEITNAGVSTINTGMVDVADCDSNLQKDVLIVPISYASGSIGTYQVRVPFKCKVTHVYGEVTLLIEATDSATVQLQDHATTNMTGGYLKFAAGSAFGTGEASTVTANNTINADEYLKILIDKATVGGTVLLSIEVLRLD